MTDGRLKLPITYGNPKDKAVINPGDQIRYDEDQGGGKNPPHPKDCILIFYKEILDEASRRYKVELTQKYWWGWLYQIDTGSSMIGMVQSGMGDSAAGLTLELLIAKGVRNIIAVGAAGSITKSCKIGDIVLASKAVRADGVSYHYEAPTRYSTPSSALNLKIRESLKGLKAKYHLGATWTTGAPFRETIGEIEQLRKEGVLCVEMEAAALFSIARFRKVSLSSLLFISDDVSGPAWNPQFHAPEYAGGRNLCLEAAISALSH